MKAVRALGRLLVGLVGAAEPVTTLLASAALLLVGVHVAAQPLAHLTQSFLDVIDAGADAVMSFVLTTWGGWMDWSRHRLESAVEDAVSTIDIPEKMAAAHAVGLVLEGALFAVFFGTAWNAEPWEWPGWMKPRAAVDKVKKWYRALPPWVRAERTLLLPVVITGAASAAHDMRAGAVALFASSSLDVPLSVLGPVGWLAMLGTLYVTLEPCPMCAGALILARVDRVVFGTWDPKAGAVGSLFRIGDDDRLNHRFEITAGVMQADCSAILTEFFRRKRALGKK